MAHTLSIAYSSTTLNLNLVDNTPKSAARSEAVVTEHWEVHIAAATSELLVEEIHKINRAFEQAKQRQEDPFLDRVFMNFIPKDLTENQRSEILDGLIEFYDETLKYAWANIAMEIKLTIKRRNYWEGDKEAIVMTNLNGIDQESLYVYNSFDPSVGSSPNIYDCSILIEGADLAGDMPAPLDIFLDSQSSLTDVILILAKNVDLSAAFVAECEDADGVSEGTDASCSGGKYGYKSFSSVDTAEDVFLFDVLIDGWSNIEKGRWYLPFLRLQTVPTIEDLWTRVVVTTGITTATEWIKVPATGGPQIIQYPPIRFGATGIARDLSGDIIIQFKTSTAGTKTINGDYVYMIPIDGMRKYTLPDFAANHILIDSADGNVAYRYIGPSGEAELIVARGNPLMVDPKDDTMLFFISPGGTNPINGYVRLGLTYRPRRRTL